MCRSCQQSRPNCVLPENHANIRLIFRACPSRTAARHDYPTIDLAAIHTLSRILRRHCHGRRRRLRREFAASRRRRASRCDACGGHRQVTADRSGRRGEQARHIAQRVQAVDACRRRDAVGQPLPQNTVANEVQGMCDYNAADFSAGASLTLGDWPSIEAAAKSGKTMPTPLPASAMKRSASAAATGRRCMCAGATKAS